MNGIATNPFFRLAVVAGLTFAAYKYAPVGAMGKTIILAVGGVSGASILGGAVPLLGSLMAGQLPLPAPAAQA